MIRFSEWLENRNINEGDATSIIRSPFGANQPIDLTSSVRKAEVAKEDSTYKLYLNIGGKMFQFIIDQKMYGDLLVAKTAGTASKIMQTFSRTV